MQLHSVNPAPGNIPVGPALRKDFQAKSQPHRGIRVTLRAFPTCLRPLTEPGAVAAAGAELPRLAPAPVGFDGDIQSRHRGMGQN